KCKKELAHRSMHSAVNSESVRDEGSEHVADVMVHDQIRNLIELGRLAVDDDEGGAVALGHEPKSRPRPRIFGGPTTTRSADRIPGTRHRWYCRAVRPRHRARCRRPEAGCRYSASPAPAPCRRDRSSPAPDARAPALPWRNSPP